MEQVGAGPVEDGHKVVADNLDAELAQVAHGGLVVLDVHIPGGLADLNVIVDIDGLHHVHVEAVGLQLLLNLCDFVNFPYFAGHLVMQRPDNAGYAGDLLDIGKGDLVIAFAIPTETHLHRHIVIPPLPKIRAFPPQQRFEGE